MILDFINISLIREFFNLKEKEEINLSEMREKIFPNLKKAQKQEKLCLLRDRLQAMPRSIFEIKKTNGKWEYRLITENVLIENFIFPNSEKQGMALKLEDRWHIIEI